MSGSSWNPDDALGQSVDWSAGIIPGTTTQADPNASGVAGSAGVMLGTGTGQAGVAPVTGGGGGMIGDGTTAVWDWLNRPFNTPMSAVDITLLVGMILIAILLWNLVLYHIR